MLKYDPDNRLAERIVFAGFHTEGHENLEVVKTMQIDDVIEYVEFILKIMEEFGELK